MCLHYLWLGVVAYLFSRHTLVLETQSLSFVSLPLPDLACNITKCVGMYINLSIEIRRPLALISNLELKSHVIGDCSFILPESRFHEIIYCKYNCNHTDLKMLNINFMILKNF